MLTAAVLGSGKMGKIHAKCYRKNSRIRRVVVWSRNQDYLEFLAREKPHLVSVCLPPDLRAEVIVPALRAGAHVLCEKPLALSLEEAKKIHIASEQFQRHVMIGYTLRFLPEIQEIKKRVKSGESTTLRESHSTIV